MSATTTIAVDSDTEQVTLVNVFTVAPERQAELVDALDRATATVFVGDPGFVSANLHASLDGTRVINYAQWTSAAAYETALARPEVREHIGEAAALAARIMRGERPAALPFQPVTRTRIIVNLDAAKAVGLVIPRTVIEQAVEVIGK